jgi:photosystem II stability/assembly factor-like uncharacterized protein
MRFRTTLLSYLLLPLGILVAGCEATTDADDPGSQGKGVGLSEFVTSYPMFGGSVKDADILPDGRIAAIVDNKLVVYNSSMQNPQTLSNEAIHMAIAAGKQGEIYAVTSNNMLRTYNSSTGQFKESPYTTQYGLWYADWRLSPEGHAYAMINHGQSRGAIFRTTNEGDSWEAVTAPAFAPASYDINFDPQGNLYLIEPSGVHRSTDRGATWTKTGSKTLAFEWINSLITKTGRLYIHVRGGSELLYSDDGGASFTQVESAERGAILMLKEGSNGELYAIRARGGGLNHFPLSSALKRSTDGGITWEHLLFCHSINFDVKGSTIVVTSGDFGGPGTNAAVEEGGYISTDNGATFESRGQAQVSELQDFLIDADGDLWLLAQSLLFERKGDRWITYGQQKNSFGKFAVNSAGDMIVSAPGGSYIKRKTKPNWGYVPMVTPHWPQGTPSITSIAPRESGEFIIGVGFERTGYSPNGLVEAIRINDSAEARLNGMYLMNLFETTGGTLHGTSMALSGSYQFYTEQWVSADGGKNWERSQTQDNRPLAMSPDRSTVLQYQKNKYLVSNGAEVTGSEITFNGFDLANERPIKYWLGNDGRVYILTTNATSAATRILRSDQSVR